MASHLSEFKSLVLVMFYPVHPLTATIFSPTPLLVHHSTLCCFPNTQSHPFAWKPLPRFSCDLLSRVPFWLFAQTLLCQTCFLCYLFKTANHPHLLSPTSTNSSPALVFLHSTCYRVTHYTFYLLSVLLYYKV